MRVTPLLFLFVCACGVGSTAEPQHFYPKEEKPAPDASVETDGSIKPVVTSSAVQISRVIDGDTVALSADLSVVAPDGRTLQGEHVRLLGIDAHEIAHPPETTQPDCWGDEGRTAAIKLMQGVQVQLEFGSDDIRDVYGRLLAYVKLPDGRVANEVLLQNSDAEAYNRFWHRDREKYKSLAKTAKAAGKGVWACK